MTTLMRAWVMEAFDEPLVLRHVPIPEPGAHQVRVRVLTSSVNPVDVAVSKGLFRGMYEYRFPAIQGRDFAGTVEAVGPGVTLFAPGDEVFGMVKRAFIGEGTFAEYVVLEEDRYLVARPPALPRAEAGALGLIGVTAIQCVDALDLERGTVFINGATGSVGSFALQIARARGLRVIATARPGDEEAHVRSLGADDTVDWSAGEVAASVRKLSSDVRGVIDLVSRDRESFLSIARIAQPGGVAVTTLGAAPAEPVDGVALRNIHSESDPVLLRRAAELMVDGTVRLRLADTFELDRLEDAFALLTSGTLGKVSLDLA